MKAFACNFEMAQNSNCSVFLKFQLEISKIRRENGFEAKRVRILSHLRVFELKKVSQLKVLTRDGYFELKLKKN